MSNRRGDAAARLRQVMSPFHPAVPTEPRVRSASPPLSTLPSGIPAYLGYWGKAHPVEGASVRWHPLAYHALDVAAAATVILRQRPLYRAAGARALGVDEASATRLAAGFIALHDLGKIEAAFQWKVPDTGARTPRRPTLSAGHHTKAGLMLWRGGLGSLCAPRLAVDGTAESLSDLADAVFGHHGRPVGGDIRLDLVRTIFTPDERRDAEAMAADLLALLMPEPVDGLTRDLAAASWWLAGLTTLADWIGSNDAWFQYWHPTLTLSAYFAHATSAAEQAVQTAGLHAPVSIAQLSFRELTATANRSLEPTPAQAWAESVPLPDEGPVLCILEDVTGSGKTEAAQMLVHRLLAKQHAGGAYWAMPTMATANAMYRRQAAAVGRLFQRGGPSPSLVLAHGQSKLDAGFRATVVADPDRLRSRPIELMDDGDSSLAQCAEWLASDRRRALLADVGAGTVDQALLAILPAKFNVLRLAGLSGKVVILDEVHAYDAYTGTLIRQLLEFLVSIGASVVLLSATLPLHKRHELVAAWTQGAGTPPAKASEASADPDHYPSAGIAPAGGAATFTAIRAAPRSHRRVGVRRIHDPNEVVSLVAERVARGEAVAWVHNTVAGCQAAAERARAGGLTPIVFHARFAQCDRQRIELEVMRRLGPESAVDRAGTLVIATQVIEQSLDLDFDAMFTDLAPIDLLLQRAGRLWRHSGRARPLGAEMVLHVLEPAARDDAPADWLSALGGSAKMYNIETLWRTSVRLDNTPELVSPDDVRAMVEAVYGIDQVLPLPEELLPKADAQDGHGHAETAVAHQSSLSVAAGYGRNANYEIEARALTRLGEPTTVLRLATRDVDGALVPWCDDVGRSERERWQLSEVSVRSSLVPPGVVSEDIDVRLSEGARESRDAGDDGAVLAVLSQAGDGTWEARLESPEKKWRRILAYSPTDGVRVLPPRGTPPP
jgi:CRISPR-associated endonuclease/helicase Cas3